MLRIPSSDEAARLRAFLMDSGYTSSGVREILHVGDLPSRRLRNVPRMLYSTRERTRANLLIRWFLIGAAVEESEALAVAPRPVVELMVSCGLLRREDTALVSASMIMPYEDLLVATDPSLLLESGEDPEVVLAINPTTMLLERFMIRRPVGSTLDFGTGCGIIALLAGRYSATVTATDINPRAVNYAAFNAQLNGMDQIECLQGDALEPVAGRRFDRILANPPFFITPASDNVYCENPLELDSFCRRLAREGPELLAEGGHLQMVCEWVNVRGQQWHERIAEWFQGAGCDVWALRGYHDEIASYCQKRLAETRPYDAAGDISLYNEWMAYYEQQQVEAVHGGIITMRRRSGSNWVRIEEMPETRQPFGEAILEGFAAQDYLVSHDDGALLAARLKLSDEAQLDHHFRPGTQGWAGDKVNLRLTGGIPYAQLVEPMVADFLGQFDGVRTLEEVVDGMAARHQAPKEAVAPECLSLARRFLGARILAAG